MLIKNISYLAECTQTRKISGGVSSYTLGNAISGYGFAGASMTSLAYGDTTSTTSITNTRVFYTPFSITSYANTKGTAIATSGNDYSKSTSQYTSSSTYINYRNST